MASLPCEWPNTQQEVKEPSYTEQLKENVNKRENRKGERVKLYQDP